MSTNLNMVSDNEGRNTFSLTITVREGDIDTMHHVNNVVYFKWVQDIATAHWNTVASEPIRTKYLWVVLRHEIDYLAPAFLDDTLLATTWVGETNATRSTRFVVIKNSETEKIMAKAKTVWCMLDSSTLKPKRITEEVTDLLKSKLL